MTDEPAFEINGSMDIYSAEALRPALEEHIRSHASVTIDLSKADRFDVAGVQLLCSAKKTAEDSGKPFAVMGAPESLRSLEEALGLP